MKPLIRTLTLSCIAVLVFAGCDTTTNPLASGPELATDYPTADASARGELQRELARARAATVRYQSIQNALDDEYEDIGVFIPNMGHHYLNVGLLLDGLFDPEKPELLVYSELPNGTMKLVAVEYAEPRDPANPQPPPEGFTGDEDQWDANLDFDLWTLHAWIWHGNPDGVFAPMNRLVP